MNRRTMYRFAGTFSFCVATVFFACFVFGSEPERRELAVEMAAFFMAQACYMTLVSQEPVEP